MNCGRRLPSFVLFAGSSQEPHGVPMDTTAELLNDEGSDEVASEFLEEVEEDHSAASWR